MNKARVTLYGLISFGLIISSFIATPALAAAPDSLSVLMSDSRKSTDSTYTITLNQATGTTPTDGETVTITFPAGFTVPAFVAADATWTDNGVSKTVQDAACGATNTVRISVSGQVVAFEACDSYSGTSGSNLVITLGTGATKVTNHATAATYTVTAAGTYGDSSKDALIAVTDGVTLSATVDETLTFTVAGVTDTNCSVSGGTDVIDTSGSAITVPFGTLTSDDFYDACQNLTVGTNAANGYSTTVKTTTLPTSGSNTILEGACDSGCSDTVAAAWSVDTNNGYGYCLKDEAGDAAVTSGWSGTNECGDGTQFFKTINRINASEIGQSIMQSAVATTTSDQTEIGYRISIDAGQAAGAYTTIIVYIATPTF